MFQLVLLFGAETRVVTHLTGRVLGGFQDQVDQRLTGRLPRIQNNGKQEYTSEAGTIEEAGFKAMEE